MKPRFLIASTLCHGAVVIGAGVMLHEHAPRPAATASVAILSPSRPDALARPRLEAVEVLVESPEEVVLVDPGVPEEEIPERLNPLPVLLWRHMPLGRLRPPEPELTEEVTEPEEESDLDSVAIPYVEAMLLPGNNSPPDYPYRARQLRQEGTVVARISVDRTGEVTKVVLVEKCPYEMLNESVLCAVSEWCFEPAMRGGVPVVTTIIQRFSFVLEGATQSL